MILVKKLFDFDLKEGRFLSKEIFSSKLKTKALSSKRKEMSNFLKLKKYLIQILLLNRLRSGLAKTTRLIQHFTNFTLLIGLNNRSDL